MQTTTFGKTGKTVSRLGFGAMRLPEKEVDGVKSFDEEESIRMIRRAYDLGVNYYDTAPYYCDKQSEIILGRAVKPFRGEIFLSTKNPIENNSGDDYQKRLENSLKNMDTDYIDFYHFWGISLQTFTDSIRVKDGPWDRALKLREQGIIRNISFSFHDKAGNISEIIRRAEGQLASVLCQYNLLDRSNEDDIAFAREQGLGVVIMGPVAGGKLGAPSKVIQDLLPGKVKSSAEVALRFVLANPNVSIALSGMSSMAMVEENAEIASRDAHLTEDEKTRVLEMMEENRKFAELYCTGCKYCMPCPQGINIPEIFTMMNYHRVYGMTDVAKSEYSQIGKVPWRKFENAAACVDCGICEDKCPQNLEIRKQLKETHALLS